MENFTAHATVKHTRKLHSIVGRRVQTMYGYGFHEWYYHNLLSGNIVTPFAHIMLLPVILPIVIPFAAKDFPAMPAASAPKENPIMCRVLAGIPAALNQYTSLASNRAA